MKECSQRKIYSPLMIISFKLTLSLLKSLHLHHILHQIHTTIRIRKLRKTLRDEEGKDAIYIFHGSVNAGAFQGLFLPFKAKMYGMIQL